MCAPPELWLFLQKQRTFAKPLVVEKIEKVSIYVLNYSILICLLV
jgi:hypothetical protein